MFEPEAVLLLASVYTKLGQEQLFPENPVPKEHSNSEWKVPERSSTHSQLQEAVLVGLVLSEVGDLLPLLPSNLFF